MFAESRTDLPLVSRDILGTLQEDLQDPGIYRSYVEQNIQMWEGRYGRLSAAIRAGNMADALDALLSVKSSSRMVGAVRLSELAETLQHCLDAPTKAVSILPELEACGRMTVSWFQDEILNRSGGISTSAW